MVSTDDGQGGTDGGGIGGTGVGVGEVFRPSPLSPAAPPSDPSPSVPMSDGTGEATTSSSVTQTIADLIAQGLSSGSPATAAQPTVVPVSGGGSSLMPLLLLVGAAAGVWYFMHKHKAAA